MGLRIQAANLISRQLRRAATGGQARVLNLAFSSASGAAAPDQSGGGGLLQTLFGWAGRIVGFVSSILNFASWSFTAAFGWVSSQVQQISQFNWNATDAEMGQAITDRNVGLAGTWGTVVGSALGSITAIGVGVGVAFLVPVVGGAALARSVASGATPEVLEEVSGNLRAAVTATAATFASNTVTSGYINIRKAIKKMGASTLTALFGEAGSNWIRNVWGSSGAPRLTIADSIENTVQGMPGGAAVRAFTAAAVEEAFDSFMEAGFIVAAELDVQIASAKAANKTVLGPERSVEIKPDRDVDEKFTLVGATTLLKPQIQNVLHHSKLLHNRDIGQIVGMPVEEWRRAKPHLKTVSVIFRDKKEAPWRHPDGSRCREASYSIPDIKPGVGWQDVKRAADAYTWGKFRATANLDNGRQMAVYGATPQDAERKLRDLLLLSSAKIITLSISEEKERNRRLKKEPTRMYPAFVTTLIRRPTSDPDSGRTIGNQTFSEVHERYQLWKREAPDNFVL